MKNPFDKPTYFVKINLIAFIKKLFKKSYVLLLLSLMCSTCEPVYTQDLRIRKVYLDKTVNKPTAERWIIPEIVFNINPAGKSTIPIINAMNTWNNVGCALKFKFNGLTNNQWDIYDNENTITYRNDPDAWLGLCTVWVILHGGQEVITECDIVLNTRYNLTSSGEGYDIESIMLHELGHAFPLDHSENPESVMFLTLYENQIRRTLSTDDKWNVRRMYPVQVKVDNPTDHFDYTNEVEVYNILGQKVSIVKTNTLIMTLENTNLPNGIYFIKSPKFGNYKITKMR